MGTLVLSEVAAAMSTRAQRVLNAVALRAGSDAKLVPVMVTRVPSPPILGLIPVIVGTPPSLTVNGVALVADPEGVVTLIGPDVAPAGTVTTTSVPDDDATTPALPPNVTVFWLGVALN